ncbi:MAG: hypothetical protein MZV70_45490 [Desulfobacterales bacterium]|nr:hypothetical protein [Desulfobacterales bacterium]
MCDKLGRRRLGGDRRRRHQALRLHAASRPGRAWADTASRSTRSTSPGRCGAQLQRRASSSLASEINADMPRLRRARRCRTC